MSVVHLAHKIRLTDGGVDSICRPNVKIRRGNRWEWGPHLNRVTCKKCLKIAKRVPELTVIQGGKP